MPAARPQGAATGFNPVTELAFVCVFLISFVASLYLQEVNLSNNQLSELPPLWETMWGSVYPATGLLALSVSVSVTATAAPAAVDGAKKDAAKVLLLGNPIMTTTKA